MKKVLIALCAAAACALCFAEGGWKNSVGLALEAPWLNAKIDGNGTKTAFAPRVSARYFGGFEKGFCVEAKAGAGLAFSEDFKLESESGFSKGLAAGASIGAGYAFGFGKRFSLAALGLVSMDWARFKFKKEIKAPVSSGYATSEWTQTDDFIAFGIGAEILANLRLTEHFSVFASAACEFLDAGFLRREGNNQGRAYDDSFDVRGKFSVTPSLGAAWVF